MTLVQLEGAQMPHEGNYGKLWGDSKVNSLKVKTQNC
jgi:hypothetical protein